MLKQFKDTDYGPFQSGVYTSPLNNSVELKRQFVKELVEGRNTNKVICGKLVAIIPAKDNVPL